MVINLSYLLEKLGMCHVSRHYNPDKSVNYAYCKWLGNTENYYPEECIYVGYSSQLNPDIPENKVGIIVINDTGIDYSSCNVDFVELDPSVDPLQLCLMIKEVFFKSFEVSNISKELIIRLLKPSGLKEIVDLTGDYLGNPVFLNFHHFGRSFFYTGDAVTTSEVKTLMQLKATLPESKTIQTINEIRSSCIV